MLDLFILLQQYLFCSKWEYQFKSGSMGYLRSCGTCLDDCWTNILLKTIFWSSSSCMKLNAILLVNYPFYFILKQSILKNAVPYPCFIFLFWIWKLSKVEVKLTVFAANDWRRNYLKIFFFSASFFCTDLNDIQLRSLLYWCKWLVYNC